MQKKTSLYERETKRCQAFSENLTKMSLPLYRKVHQVAKYLLFLFPRFFFLFTHLIDFIFNHNFIKPYNKKGKLMQTKKKVESAEKRNRKKEIII